MALQPTIRGHQAFFKLFRNGQQVIIDALTNVSINQEKTIEAYNYVGKAVPETDVMYMGWSGSFEIQVRDSTIEDFIDALITENLNGIGVSDCAFLCTENYPNGTTVTYVYTDCKFGIARQQGGSDSKITKTLDWRAGGRVKA